MENNQVEVVTNAVLPYDVVESLADAAAFAGWLVGRQIINPNGDVTDAQWKAARSAIDAALADYFVCLESAKSLQEP